MAGKLIFVFGSNTQGRHGRGAALEAKLAYGAIYGQAEGRQGDSYAIITKELRNTHPPVGLQKVQDGIMKFIEYAKAHPEDQFMVTRIGCGLAGFTDQQIAPMFRYVPDNVRLPKEWEEG